MAGVCARARAGYDALMGASQPDEPTPGLTEPIVDADDLSSAEFDTPSTQETQQRTLSEETIKKIQAKEKARKLLEELADRDQDPSE